MSQRNAYEKTRFWKEHLRKLKEVLFGDLDSEWVSIKEHAFHVEEVLIIALYHNARALPYSEMYEWLGGDWWAHTYPINWFDDYIFHKYYHQISGDSMAFWAPQTDDFCAAIWKKIAFMVDEESGACVTLQVSQSATVPTRSTFQCSATLVSRRIVFTNVKC